MKMRRQRRIRTVLIAVAVGGWLGVAGGQQKAPTPQRQSADALLGAAQYQEQIEGKLEAAIATYRRALAAADATREQKARAQFRIGVCYEHLGQGEARKAYEAVVANFADQADLAAQAKARMAVLGESRSRTSAATMTVRRVWSGGEQDPAGAVSPDGRYLSFADPDTEDLAVRDLETGENRRLTHNGSGTPDGQAFGSRWSPDGRQIVYDWYDGVSTNGWGKSGLRMMSLKTGESRVLCQSREGYEVNTYDWSPDGKYILASVMDAKRGASMRLIPVEDGSERVLKAGTDWGYSRFSPDGRYIAYTDHYRGESDIFLFSLADARETRLVEHPANDLMLEWSPDGKWVLFASDRSGAFGVWAIQVANGKPLGIPQLIKLDMPRIVPMGITRSGSFYYGYAPLMTDVYVAKLDVSTGKVAGPPELAVPRFQGISASPAYSPDGKYLAYVCADGPMSAMASSTHNIVRVRALDTGAEKEFSTELYGIDTLSWFPDGSAILLAGHHDSRVYKVDLQSGQVTTIIGTIAGVIVRDHDMAADGSAFYYVRLELEKDLCQIMLRNLADGTEKELYRAAAAEQFRIARSPDGKWLAYLNRTDNRVLRIMPANGGEPRDVFRFEQKGRYLIPISWTADGKYILFARPDKDSNEALWRVSVSDGKAERMGIEKGCESVNAHPDGRRLAFSLTERAPTEVWVMENFLAALKPGR